MVTTLSTDPDGPTSIPEPTPWKMRTSFHKLSSDSLLIHLLFVLIALCVLIHVGTYVHVTANVAVRWRMKLKPSLASAHSWVPHMCTHKLYSHTHVKNSNDIFHRSRGKKKTTVEKFTWKHKRVLRQFQEEKASLLVSIPDLKFYYRAIMFKN